jgi:hypothetical protein
MGMPRKKDTPFGKRRKIPLVKNMPVGSKKSAPLINYNAIVPHAGKVQQHLVYLGITIPPNGDNPVCIAIQQIRHSLRVMSFRQGIPGTVVENIPQQNKVIGVECIEPLHRLLGKSE